MHFLEKLFKFAPTRQVITARVEGIRTPDAIPSKLQDAGWESVISQSEQLLIITRTHYSLMGRAFRTERINHARSQILAEFAANGLNARDSLDVYEQSCSDIVGRPDYSSWINRLRSLPRIVSILLLLGSLLFITSCIYAIRTDCQDNLANKNRPDWGTVCDNPDIFSLAPSDYSANSLYAWLCSISGSWLLSLGISFRLHASHDEDTPHANLKTAGALAITFALYAIIGAIATHGLMAIPRSPEQKGLAAILFFPFMLTSWAATKILERTRIKFLRNIPSVAFFTGILATIWSLMRLEVASSMGIPGQAVDITPAEYLILVDDSLAPSIFALLITYTFCIFTLRRLMLNEPTLRLTFLALLTVSVALSVLSMSILSAHRTGVAASSKTDTSTIEQLATPICLNEKPVNKSSNPPKDAFLVRLASGYAIVRPSINSISLSKDMPTLKVRPTNSKKCQ